ncbi:MAG: hypothetical protein M3Q30_13945 [Actinomycetota bacterium]|nr:hypothetical protein [Actinomycetota bacterium]
MQAVVDECEDFASDRDGGFVLATLLDERAVVGGEFRSGGSALDAALRTKREPCLVTPPRPTVVSPKIAKATTLRPPRFLSNLLERASKYNFSLPSEKNVVHSSQLGESAKDVAI